jgi:uncharacterized repeat protein (TIGR01451 family)
MPLKRFATASILAVAALLLWSYRATYTVEPAHIGAGNDRLVSGAPAQQVNAHLHARLDDLPLTFIENQGQLDRGVAYYVQGRDTSLYFSAQGLTFALSGSQQRFATEPRFDRFSLSQADAAGMRADRQHWTVALDFVGAALGRHPLGREPVATKVSYFQGARSQWKTNLPTYSSLVYSELWPGIDLIYNGTASQLKYTFLVKLGADPRQIRLRYRGASSVAIGDQGQIVVSTPAGGFEDARPYVYQQVGGQPVAVDSAYQFEDDAFTYGFRLGAYDSSKPLLIDPTVFIYAGYIGGTEAEEARAIAVDGNRDAYVTGETQSLPDSFPLKVGPDLTMNGGSRDAFVAKIRADGLGLDYAGYIGGTGVDQGNAIAVGSDGSAYIVGQTTSSEESFPVLGGPDLTYNGGLGNSDGFIAKVKADGTALVYAGYIGGAGEDFANGVGVDGAGNAYLVGSTSSQQASFPVKVGPDLTFNGGVPDMEGFISDAFVAKVQANGSGLVYAGYIGGAGNEYGRGMAVDSAGNAYVSGATASSEASFPVSGGPDLTFNGGSFDAFVAKVNPGGSALTYAGYIGGDGQDTGDGIALDNARNAYLVGITNSPETSFPVSGGPDLTFNGGQYDAFVAKVAASGSSLAYAGYVGGDGDERGWAIAVDTTGSAYITGLTDSSETSFPVKEGPDLTYNGGQDAYIVRIQPDGAGLIYGGYVGGSATDWAFGIAVDRDGYVYVAGMTSSDETTFPATRGPNVVYTGRFTNDAFIAKIGEGQAADLAISTFDAPDPVYVNSQLTYTITITNAGPTLATGVTVTDNIPANVAELGQVIASQGVCAGSLTITCALGSLNVGATATVTVTVRPLVEGALSNTASVVADQSDSNLSSNQATATTTVRRRTSYLALVRR